MKLKKLFEHAVDIGIDSDIRGRKYLERMLKKEADRQKKLEGKDKEYADPERTWNPYSDSRIIAGTGEEEVTRVMVGIDIETPEILMADRLREKGEKIDAIMIHHPEGRTLGDLNKVMTLNSDVVHSAGVPINQGDFLLRPRMERVGRATHADNLMRVERAAELMGFPALVCHTITDNLVFQLMEKTISQKPWNDLGEILNAIHGIQEYDFYAKRGNPAFIVNGNAGSRPGKIIASGFTGGTNGPEELIEQQAHAGVGTILCMHFTEKEVEIGRKHNVNMIQCSHMASDVIGMNLLLDQLSKHEKKLSTVDVSGFIRVKRK